MRFWDSSGIVPLLVKEPTSAAMHQLLTKDRDTRGSPSERLSRRPGFGDNDLAMSQTERLIGQTLEGKYLLERMLGRGGMGAVYQARHVGTDRPVALKVIASGLTANAEAIARFGREARAAGRLQHPNVVNVTDFGVASLQSESTAYLVMELLQGETLATLLDREGKLPLRTTVEIVEQVALALGEAHRHGIIHRDLKPDNIWLEPDRRGGYKVKVLDFGVAKLRDETLVGELENRIVAAPAHAAPTLQLHADQPEGNEPTMIRVTTDRSAVPVPRTPGASTGALTRLGSVVGTPAYMSPEQCRGEPLDPRSDIYALGVVTYQMLSGERPFHGDTASLLVSHISGQPPDLRVKRRDLPKGLSEVVMAALAKDPAQRPSSAVAFTGMMRVRAEGATMLLRRAVAMTAEHLELVWRLALVSALPVLALALPVGAVIPFSSRAMIKIELGAFGILGFMLIAMNSHALFAVAASRLRMTPFGLLSARAVLRELGSRLGVSDRAGLVRICLAASKLFLRCEAWAARRAFGKAELTFLIALLEKKEPATAATRAAALARQLPKTLDVIRGTLLAILLASAFGLGVLVGVTGTAAKADRALLMDVIPAVCFASLPVLSVIIMPVFSIAFALFYFTARQAAGEEEEIE